MPQHCPAVLEVLLTPAFLSFLLLFIAQSFGGFWLQGKISRLERLERERSQRERQPNQPLPLAGAEAQHRANEAR